MRLSRPRVRLPSKHEDRPVRKKPHKGNSTARVLAFLQHHIAIHRAALSIGGKTRTSSLCSECAADLKKGNALEDISSVLREWGITEAQADTSSDGGEDYFSTARLSRKQARDTAISMLEDAKGEENASEEVANEASETLQVLAGYTVAETQIENLVVAKGYADCVAFMGADSISVVVSAPDGLEAEDVAKIKDIVIAETSYNAGQIKIMEAGTGKGK